MNSQKESNISESIVNADLAACEAELTLYEAQCKYLCNICTACVIIPFIYILRELKT